MDPGKKELLKREGSQELILENLDGQVCLREPVVKTMLDPRFEQADRRIRAKMLFEKTTLIKPDGRCFEELKREVIEEGRKIIEMEMNLLNMKRLKISEADQRNRPHRNDQISQRWNNLCAAGGKVW
ncbi:Oidioi.mRNA.OKI2018_I69.chr1.g1392.t1.cds [Oikopleura dioica]|uniref:Oidioi.mRNA.OKI2018_I69.chr1.g1392.t1.cds n=1 Tax=Oikopleura dioica TaxID=34765 RepID=A0ABN7SUR8_OIKDI|nr:Oidioi.mRNA.OKI2018_I69.chr1.g1392.t1.cds [Oikopleura dioica]